MKRFSLLILTLALCAGMTNAEVYNGFCGRVQGSENGLQLQWKFDTETGLLEITGSGTMADYPDAAPWEAYRNDITAVSLPEGLLTIGKRAFCYCALTEVRIPSTVIAIGENAFTGSLLHAIVIPDEVRQIGELAFAYTSAVSLTIGHGLTAISYRAFGDCNHLESIICKAPVPPACNGNVFYNVPTSIPVHVPDIDAYRLAEGWSGFTNWQDIQFDPSEGVLPGRFSINAEGGQVVFSKGNLQCRGAEDGSYAWEWRFANTQYQYLALFPTLPGKWSDFFSWGTGDNPYCRMPTLYPFLDGNQGDIFANAVSQESWTNRIKQDRENGKDIYSDFTVFNDWGDNPILNGGNQPKSWRTLTYDEWYYLIFERPNVEHRLGVAMIDTVEGLVILPDEWIQPEGVPFKDFEGCGFWREYRGGWEDQVLPLEGFQSNVFSPNEWQKMEDAGAVFLAQTGYYYTTLLGQQITKRDGWGEYWSSTLDKPQYFPTGGNTLSGYNYSTAYTMRIYDSGDLSYYKFQCYLGASVRLVRDVASEEEEGTTQLQSNQVPTTKFLRNGQLLINRNGKTFNALGAQVK